jgi:hypothetical protein
MSSEEEEEEDLSRELSITGETPEQELLRLRLERDDARQNQQDSQAQVRQVAEFGQQFLEQNAELERRLAEAESARQAVEGRLEEAEFGLNEVLDERDAHKDAAEQAQEQLIASSPTATASGLTIVALPAGASVSQDAAVQPFPNMNGEESTRMAAMEREQARLKQEAKDLEARSDQEVEA